MTEPSPSSPTSSMLERLSRAPGRRAGIVAAVVAVVMLMVPVLELVLLSESTDPVVAVQIFLGLNAVALLGFLPLLRAVHAVTGRAARAEWLLVGAYLVLLIRPLVLTIEIATAPTAVFGGLAFFYALLGTTGVAAGLAAVSLQPTHDARGETVGGPLRSVVIGVGTGFFVALTLFAFAPYVAPLTALGIAVALSLRKPPLPPDPWEERVA
ncbi:MAG: hypothetical protein RJQ01_04295 [Microcella sp.]|uniref:hypothetical protein n=1 Tax=Microcella sp. TaxID=1913979 RepID=UPI0033147F60